ncbi:hypothetical protein RHA1_ro02689 [Rhodococcus jostii RHA1]|uniref:Uncharacterized protein n=1 Tax=Rhodococcus jostii (strain RHA1) TaxID=101510 RepID=Q0SD92_RHOJR|nr:hypothetical protein RHA1_ro02689 [Rhodococcus jostii RHA1]
MSSSLPGSHCSSTTLNFLICSTVKVGCWRTPHRRDLGDGGGIARRLPGGGVGIEGDQRNVVRLAVTDARRLTDQGTGGPPTWLDVRGGMFLLAVLMTVLLLLFSWVSECQAGAELLTSSEVSCRRHR